MGKVLKAKTPLESIWSSTKGPETAQEMIQFNNATKPDIIFDFHCTDANSSYWKREQKADFVVMRSGRLFEPKNAFVVEIKAVFKALPPKIIDRIKKSPIQGIREMGVNIFGNYLTKTTVHKETIAVGLDPVRLAVPIAAVIHERAKPNAKQLPHKHEIRGKILKRIKRRPRR